VIKEPDGRWQDVNFDKRVSMDIEGKSAEFVHRIKIDYK
jgi:hypothetical protein